MENNENFSQEELLNMADEAFQQLQETERSAAEEQREESPVEESVLPLGE
jgi:hypothetical protein